MKHLKIEKAKQKHLKLILNIDNRVADSPWGENIFKNCIDLYECFILLYKKKLIGYIFMSKEAEQSEILNFAIKPEYQGQGLSKKLLTFGLEHLKSFNIPKVSLEVKFGNDPAINLYKKYGFVQTGVREGYYDTKDGPVDALVLSLDLS